MRSYFRLLSRVQGLLVYKDNCSIQLALDLDMIMFIRTQVSLFIVERRLKYYSLMEERFILLTRGYGFIGDVPPLFCHAKNQYCYL